jgi:hypothetical protein
VGDELTLDGQLQWQRQSVFEFIAIESGDGAGMADKRAGVAVMGLCIHESSGGGVEEAVVVDKPLSYWTDDTGGEDDS